MEKFLKNIDFKDLKKQKKTLLEAITKAETQKEQDNLNGILHLIDSIQDIAVDEYGYKENKVFMRGKKD